MKLYYVSSPSLAASGRAAAVLATTVGLFATVAATAPQADGEQVFQQRCGGCHSIEADQNRVGPHLSGVIGRTAGSIEGARYSAAMPDSGVVWDSQSLDTFLAAPRQTVRGHDDDRRCPRCSPARSNHH